MGRLKIVIPYGMDYIPMDMLEKYEGNVYVVKYGGSKENDTPFQMIHIPNPDLCLGEARVTLGCGRYDKLLEMSKEIEACFDMNRDDVLVVTDGTPESMLIGKYLQKKTTGYYGNLHLWAFMPFMFTRSATIHMDDYLTLLDELTEIKSLAITDLNDFVDVSNNELDYKEITKEICETTGEMMDFMLAQFPSMERARGSFKYFFDNVENRYVVASNLRMVEKKYVHRLMGICVEDIDGNENKNTSEAISRPSVRIDGQEVCDELRRLRHEFATANGLDYEFRICTYEGPCAGTCDYCEYEAKELYELALKKVDGDSNKVVFPKSDLEGKFSQVVNQNDDKKQWIMGEVCYPFGEYKTRIIEKKEWDDI